MAAADAELIVHPGFQCCSGFRQNFKFYIFNFFFNFCDSSRYRADCPVDNVYLGFPTALLSVLLNFNFSFFNYLIFALAPDAELIVHSE